VELPWVERSPPARIYHPKAIHGPSIQSNVELSGSVFEVVSDEGGNLLNDLGSFSASSIKDRGVEQRRSVNPGGIVPHPHLAEQIDLDVQRDIREQRHFFQIGENVLGGVAFICLMMCRIEPNERLASGYSERQIR
jgi:hypothetical protein